MCGKTMFSFVRNCQTIFQSGYTRDLTGGPAVKNLPAMQGHGFDARSRETTFHGATMPVCQLKPQCPEPVLHNKKNQCNEKPVHCKEE